MDDASQKFNLDGLSQLTDLPVRTIRYYIQSGLIAKPTGVGRGAHYTQIHLDQLLEIRKWQQAGLSLSRIQELLEGRSDTPLPPTPPIKPGAISVKSHVHIGPGIELVLDPAASDLTPEQVRALGAIVVDAATKLQQEEE